MEIGVEDKSAISAANPGLAYSQIWKELARMPASRILLLPKMYFNAVVNMSMNKSLWGLMAMILVPPMILE